MRPSGSARPTTCNLGLQTVWKNYYLQGLHQSTDIGEVLINKDFWDKLPPDLQEIVRAAAMASMMETYTFNVYRNAQAMVKLRKKHQGADPRHAEGLLPGVREGDQRRAGPLRGQGPVLQGSARLAAQLRQDVVPYWTKILDLYSNLGNAALKKRR